MATATSTVTQFTDPICTWCLGSEPIVRHLQVSYREQVRIEYVMGWLVEDFERFHDAANDISEPSDVDPSLEQSSPPATEEFVDDYGLVATRKVAEVYDLDRQTAAQRLEAFAADGVVLLTRPAVLG